MLNPLIPFGFLPVIAYLAVDSLAGRRKALWAALAVASAEMGFAIASARGADPLGLLQYALLAGLVFAALRAEDDFYFRVQGALASILSAAVLMVAWYAYDRALLLDFFSRQGGLDKLVRLDARLTRENVSEMLRLLSYQLPWWLMLHALFTVYAAVNWGKWAWAAVRIPGFLLALFLASGMSQGEVIREVMAEQAAAAKAGKAAGPAAPAPAPARPGPAADSAAADTSKVR